MKKHELLKIIQNNPGINVQDLTQESRINSNMVIKLLNDMERDGWITRHRFYQFTCQVITKKGLDKLNPKPAPKPAKPKPARSKPDLDAELLADLKSALENHPDMLEFMGTDNAKNPYMALPKHTGMIA